MTEASLAERSTEAGAAPLSRRCRLIRYFRMNAKTNLHLRPMPLEREQNLRWIATASAAGDVALLAAVSQLAPAERASELLDNALVCASAGLPLSVFAVLMMRFSLGETALKFWAGMVTGYMTMISAALTGLGFYCFIAWFGARPAKAFAVSMGVCAAVGAFTMYRELRVAPPLEFGTRAVGADDHCTEDVPVSPPPSTSNVTEPIATGEQSGDPAQPPT